MTSLVISFNCLVPAEQVLLHSLVNSGGADIVAGPGSYYPLKPSVRDELLRPVKSSVENVNIDTQITKEIPSNNYIIGAKPYD